MNPSTPLRSEHPEWLRVGVLYRSVGLVPLLDVTVGPDGYVYSNGVVALAGDYLSEWAMALHDLAHWLVAPPKRRSLPNFGLGQHPNVPEMPKAHRAGMSWFDAQEEEGAASWVHVHLTRASFGSAASERIAELLNFEPHEIESPRDSYRNILENRGLLRPGERSLQWPPSLARLLTL